MLSPEKFCDDVKQALIDGLPAALQAQTDAWQARDQAEGRSIVLEPPRVDKDYYIGGAGILVRYPAVEIAVSDMGIDTFAIQNADADTSPKLMVRVSFQDAKSVEVLYRTGCRWFAAVTSILSEDSALPDLDISAINAHWRNNPQQNEAAEIQSGVLMVFDLEGPLSPFMS